MLIFCIAVYEAGNTTVRMAAAFYNIIHIIGSSRIGAGSISCFQGSDDDFRGLVVDGIQGWWLGRTKRTMQDTAYGIFSTKD